MPGLSAQAPANDASDQDAALTQEQHGLLDALYREAHALSWPVDASHLAGPEDVAEFFRALRNGAAQLHRIHRDFPATPKLASCINALGELLARLNAALKRDVKQGGLDGAAFDIDQLKAIFGALSALADPGHPALFSRQQRRTLQAWMQELTASLLPRVFHDPASFDAQHLPLLNWVCRGVKKGLLKPDDAIAAIFDKAVTGMDKWLSAEDEDHDAFRIGECAAILNTVIDHDLLRVEAMDAGREEKSMPLTLCVMELLSDRALAVLERPPVNGVAVINLCNLVKELLEAGTLAVDATSMPRLLNLILNIPNETMSGGDGPVLSNAANFLRALMPHKAEDAAGEASLPEALIRACGRVLAALNARAFGESAKGVQSLANLASFLQDLHCHVLPRHHDEGMRKSLASAVVRLSGIIVAAGAGAVTERMTVDALLAAMAYFQEKGLCEKTAPLLKFCSDLAAKRSGLQSEQVPTPARLNAIDAALPALSAAPKLTPAQSSSASSTRSEAQQKRIPGDGRIVTPPMALTGEQISASTTYLKPAAGKGKFARANQVKADAISLAAWDALHEETPHKGSGEKEHAEHEDAVLETGTKGRKGDSAKAPDDKPSRGRGAGAGKRSRSNRHGQPANAVRLTEKRAEKDAASTSALNSQTGASAGFVPGSNADPTGTAAFISAIRNGDAREMERLIKQLTSLPGRWAPALPETFLAEVCNGNFLSGRGRVLAFDIYLRGLGKAGIQVLTSHFASHPPASYRARELLVHHGIVKRYAINLYQVFLRVVLQAIHEGQGSGDFSQLAGVVAESDEACMQALARESGGLIRLTVVTALLESKRHEELERFVRAMENDEQRGEALSLLLRTTIMSSRNDEALQLLRQMTPVQLCVPAASVQLSDQSAEQTLFSMPMYAIAHDRHAVLEAMFRAAPEVFETRHMFGYSVFSVALLKDQPHTIAALLEWLRPECVDALATEPELSPEEDRFRRPGVTTIRLKVDSLSGFNIGHMPGFNLIGTACAVVARKCLPLLLAHDGGRIAQQRSAGEWQAIFAWPDLDPELRRLIETFILSQLHACATHGELTRLAHWIESAPHLLARPDPQSGKIALGAAIGNGRHEAAVLLLGQEAKAQLDALRQQAGAADWVHAFPGIDEQMLALLNAAEDRGNA